jgi:hypothetical protein
LRRRHPAPGRAHDANLAMERLEFVTGSLGVGSRGLPCLTRGDRARSMSLRDQTVWPKLSTGRSGSTGTT